MSNTHGFVQLPSDGIGKQVAQSVMVEIEYNNGTIDFIEGDVVTFSTSTWTGTIIKSEGTTSVGEIHIRVEEPVPESFNVQVAENIIVDGATNATVSASSNPYYFQQNVMVGKDMINQLEIDELGNAYVRFDEGSPQFDAFGKLQTSQAHKIAEYINSYDDLSGFFSTVITGGATSTYNNDTRGVTLTCGTASGDKVVRTTDQYHAYQAGISQLIEFTAALGDTGKANVTRRAGYYDDENGIYFEMADTTFGVGLRSRSTGSVVDMVYPQAEWNRDRLDGSSGLFNPSNQQVDPTKDNIFWIDLQWLGAGTVRFGVIVNGVRIICHEIQNSNTLTHSYMSTGSLPFRYEQENTGIAASPSTIKIFCATIKSEGKYEPFKLAGTKESSASVTTVSEVPLLGIRAGQTFKGYDNRTSIYPREFTVHNPAAEPVIISLALGATITGGTWSAHGGESTAEVNSTATSVSGGNVGFSTIIGAGETRNIEFNTLDDNRIGIRRKADINAAPLEVAIRAKLLFAGTGATVYVNLNWDEVRD